MRRLLLLGALSLTLGLQWSCGSTPEANLHPDADLTADGTGDANFPDTGPDGLPPDFTPFDCGSHCGDGLADLVPDEWGKICSDNSDCTSGICLYLTPTQSVCTVRCIEECPMSWRCQMVADTGPDWVFACMPPTLRLCDKCETDEDCGFAGDLCVPMGDTGTFCAIDCSAGQKCPTDYVCTDIRDENDLLLGKQCMPKTGSCDCTPVLNGKVRECSVKNQFGECLGLETCDGPSGWTGCDAKLPGLDLCNGVDDDCDGTTDEEFTSEPCQKQNSVGTCVGQTFCNGADGERCSALEPAAESCDEIDNDCNGQTDEGFPDSDIDGQSDCLDKDDDNDGVLDLADNCPLDSNLGQLDTDKDDQGDKCDQDDDNDQVDDVDDNCSLVYNPGQNDLDNDGVGDACEGDTDQDGKPDVIDNCPFVANSDQVNTDNDALGNACDLDDDNDSVPDEGDNCTLDANPQQEDMDTDQLGDLCDDDIDGDDSANGTDCKPYDPDVFPGQAESCGGFDDNCNGVVDEGFPDTDGDHLADCLDPDDDGDQDPDVSDCAPLDDTAGHGATEVCNGYDDNCDGYGDEGCPATSVQLHLGGGASTVSDDTYRLRLRFVTPSGTSEDVEQGYRITWSYHK